MDGGTLSDSVKECCGVKVASTVSVCLGYDRLSLDSCTLTIDGCYFEKGV